MITREEAAALLADHVAKRDAAEAARTRLHEAFVQAVRDGWDRNEALEAFGFGVARRAGATILGQHGL